MREWELRERVCEIGRRLDARGFAAANEGNVSARLGPGRFLCTPTLTGKGQLRPHELCVVNAAGDQVMGPRPRTSEVRLHLRIYEHRPDVQAVVHSHPPHAVAFALTGTPLPDGLLAEMELCVGPVPTAPYATTGTWAFADTVVPLLPRRSVVLLARHGVVAFAATLERALFWTELVDAYCRVLLLAKPLGEPVRLTAGQVAELLAIKRAWGFDDPRLSQDG